MGAFIVIMGVSDCNVVMGVVVIICLIALVTLGLGMLYSQWFLEGFVFTMAKENCY
jgi:hypothetical protein